MYNFSEIEISWYQPFLFTYIVPQCPPCISQNFFSCAKTLFITKGELTGRPRPLPCVIEAMSRRAGPGGRAGVPAGAGQSAPCLSADQTSQSVEGARGGTHMPGSESRFLRENPMGLAWIGQLSLGQSAVAVGQAGQLVVLRYGGHT